MSETCVFCGKPAIIMVMTIANENKSLCQECDEALTEYYKGTV